MFSVRPVVTVVLVGMGFSVTSYDACARRGYAHPHNSSRPSSVLPAVPTLSGAAVTSAGQSSNAARSYLSAYGQPTPLRDTDESFAPPSYATAPRGPGAVYGSNYFERSSYAGPSRRGRAFDVKPGASY
jgi:hypothetical protein